MRAAVFAGPGRIECREVPDPVPGPGQLLVRTHRASICGSDVHVVFDGFSRYEPPGPPGYPGHEGVGHVAEAGAGVEGFQPGDPVLCCPEPAVSMCFAELQVIAATSAIPLPADADIDRLLLAQQLGTVLFAARRFFAGADPRATAVVIGAGSVGLYFLQALRHAGFRRIAVSDLEPHRLDLARELGASVTVLAPAESIVEAALELSGGVGAGVVIEAAGYDRCRGDAILSAATEARVGLFGYPEVRGDAPFPFEAAFRKALTIQTSTGTQREPGLSSFREAVRAIAAGEYAVDYMLAPVYPVERVQEAFEAARARQAVKIGVGFGG